jgi:hypothetical protein
MCSDSRPIGAKSGICIFLLILVAVLLAGRSQAQTLTDFGPNHPAAGVNDISQFSTNGNTQLTASGGFNYFTDNANPPGQTFTTGSNPLVITSVAIKTGCAPTNYGGGGLGPQPYQLRLFSILATRRRC